MYTDRWMVQDIVGIHTVEYYSALKKEILSCVTARMNFVDIMLSEISHEMINTKSFHLYKVFKVFKVLETERRMVVVKERG